MMIYVIMIRVCMATYFIRTKTLFVGLVMVFSPGAAMEEFSQDFAEVFAKLSGPSILQNIISCLYLCQFLHD